ncbi:MAG TPA: NAD-dependent epimerase/dehydratase family protein [Candidatus Angelobacter sp.]|nr:NAD-dependent epimerase/dehydratase family protein [Candidatus Angelobacter sp.]
MERLLITGGSGFVGSALARAIQRLRPDYSIRILDLLPPATDQVEYVNGNVVDRAVVERAVQDCTAVAHLAAAVGVDYTERNGDTVRKVNEIGTWNVLDSAYRAGIEKLLFASSSEVYGDSQVQPIPETAVLAPKSVYGESKLKGEEFVAHFRALGARLWRVVRFFNLYGPQQRPAFVVSRFVNAVARNEPPVIYGPGTQVRSFCHIDDGVQCVMQALFSDTNGEFIFNIGNSSEPVSVAALAERVIALNARDLKPRFIPFIGSDRTEDREIWTRIPDISRAARYLGYKTAISLDSGLTDMLRHAVVAAGNVFTRSNASA